MHKKKKVSILNFDLSDNSLGRAYVIAKILENEFAVEILGPARKKCIWEPLQDSDIPIKITGYAKFPLLLFKLPSILKKLDGDILYAIKPRFTSFGIALIKKVISGKPLVLDIDDWEVGFYIRADFFGKISRLVHVFNPNGFLWTFVLQFFIRFANRKTTASTFLQKKYGGIIIPHVKDTEYLNPGHFDKATIKRELNLEEKKVVMFCGTPRQHKGVEDALNAVVMIEDRNTVLVVVGCNPEGEYEKKLAQQGGGKIILIPKVPSGKIPYYLSAADVVVVPQRQTTDTIGQVPSKLFDAMAMAKPIIATRVSDIPLILDDCGILIAPEDIHALKEKIEWLIQDPQAAAILGEKARQRCIEKYNPASVKLSMVRTMREAMNE